MSEVVHSVEVMEVTGEFWPEDGVALDQALSDAQLEGYESIDRRGDHAIITWFRKK